MDDFESQLAECRGAVERFVYYRMPNKYDADDVLQDTYLSAHLKYSELKDKSCFKPWILSIARNKCTDFFRKKANEFAIPLDDLTQRQLAYGRGGRSEITAVRDTLDSLKDRDKQILYLCFFQNMPQADIAKKFGIPLGTVKSRLHTAKERFKEKYPYSPRTKGDVAMKRLPEYLPEYAIEKLDGEAFPVKFEELPNWFIIPREGESVRWASYDMPSRRKTEECFSTAIGKVELHGVTGVEIRSVFSGEGCDENEHFYLAQLTDTHCRWLGERYLKSDGVWHCLTFLDGEAFTDEWGFGENNCGVETDLVPNGKIILSDGALICPGNDRCFDVVGRYSVTLGGKKYDTVRALEYFPNSILTESYIGRDGRTVLWRRFNCDGFGCDGQKWSERFPDNERLNINGDVYVNWYNCISDHIL